MAIWQNLLYFTVVKLSVHSLLAPWQGCVAEGQGRELLRHGRQEVERSREKEGDTLFQATHTMAHPFPMASPSSIARNCRLVSRLICWRSHTIPQIQSPFQSPYYECVRFYRDLHICHKSPSHRLFHLVLKTILCTRYYSKQYAACTETVWWNKVSKLIHLT